MLTLKKSARRQQPASSRHVDHRRFRPSFCRTATGRPRPVDVPPNSVIVNGAAVIWFGPTRVVRQPIQHVRFFCARQRWLGGVFDVQCRYRR